MTTSTKVALRIEAAQLHAVMDHLDKAESVRDATAKRRYTRYPFRTRAPINMLCQRADGSIVYEAATRNVSARGLSVLFGAFIYPETPCQVSLPTTNGGLLQVSGILRWCRHISRTVHEGGIEFHDRIDLAEVLSAAPSQDRSEVETTSGDLYNFIEKQAARLATLARDQRSLPELREAFDKLRRAIDREEASKSNWVQ